MLPPLVQPIYADKALDDLSRANEMLRVDIEKWGASKDREMCSLMKHLGDSHITYHQKVHGSCPIVISLGYSMRQNFNSH